VADGLRQLKPSLPTGIEIREDVRATAGVFADETMVNQVLLNLCTNAAQAMGARGGVLAVSVTDVDVDAELAAAHPDLFTGRYVRLTVADTGTGMTSEVRERIFEPFFTTKGVGQGTGMGLSVVHGIVTHCGGVVLVDSTPGAGTTVRVFLPAIAAAEAPRPRGPAPVVAPARPSGLERILVVDDEELLATLHGRLLTALGYAPTTFTRPGDALAELRRDPRAFDLVITDLAMPAMNGIEVAREVRAIRPDLPILLCTGYGTQLDEASLGERGIRALLHKPFTQAALGAKIREALHPSS
jgi:CheY-like chemotaxis protein